MHICFRRSSCKVVHAQFVQSEYVGWIKYVNCYHEQNDFFWLSLSSLSYRKKDCN